MVSSLGLGLVLLTFLIQGTRTKDCAPKKYGGGNMVCVCNSTHCDTVKYDAETELLSGKAIRFTSSEGGLRFYKSEESFQSLDNFNPDLIPPSKLYVNVSQQYQVILGFGASLTDAAGFNIASLKKDAQDHLLRSYFTEEGIGYTQIKVPMAANDYSGRRYSYAEVQNDHQLKNFSLVKEDYKYKIPFLKEVGLMSETPVKLHSSVWTAPSWMKNTGLLFRQRSSLKREYYQLWADYFVRFLEAYQKEGIKFWAMSAQNEPSLGTAWYLQPAPESMGWSNADLKTWIRDYLVPTLGKSGYSYIKILGLDDDSSTLPKWSKEVLEDTTVKNYISGIALHWYADHGKNFPDVLSRTHESFPEKFIFYNDASLGPSIHPPASLGSWQSGEKYANHIFKVLKNWASGWMEGNMVLNCFGGPSFLDRVNDAAIIVNATANEFYKQPTYYIIGHFSRFIPPNSVRIDLRTFYPNDNLDAVAFITPNGTITIVVMNNGYQDEDIEVIDPVFGVIRFTLETRSITSLIYSTEEITTTATSTTDSTTVTIPTTTTTTTTTTSTTAAITKPQETTTTTSTTAAITKPQETTIVENPDLTEEDEEIGNQSVTNSLKKPTFVIPKNANGTASSILPREWHLYAILIPACIQLYLIY